MSSILATALTGLTNSASRIADAAATIVKASSTISASSNPASSSASSPDNGLTEALVAIKSETAIYGANAKVIETAAKLDQTLINIKT